MKMKKMKFVVVLAVLTAFLSCGSVVDQTELSGQVDISAYTSGLPAVQLINAKTVVQNGSLSSTYNVKFAGDIELENIAYSKDVKVVYSVDGGAWKEASASYVKSLGNNREQWKFSLVAKTVAVTGDPRAGYSGPKVSIQFALKYTVNGKVYWDNNGGIGVDYRITTRAGSGTSTQGPIAFAKQNVVLEYATYTDFPSTYFRGFIGVKKMNGKVGTVNVVYTIDNWKTVQTATASALYADYPDQQVLFFVGPGTGDWQSVIQFAISHDVNGQTYWDNNVGQNYTVKAGVTAPY